MKKSLYLVTVGICLLIITFACAPKEKMPRVIPMKDFFRNPETVSFRLSPDGQYLAFLKPWQTRLNVYVQKIGEDQPTRITSATERDIAGYFWASNSRIAYVQDKGGDENFRLYAVNIDGSEEKDLTPFEKVQVQLIDDLKDDDDHVLAGMNKRDPRFFDAYRINVLTGEMEMIAQNPGNIMGWQTDHDGKLRVATTSDGVNTSLLYRDSEKDDFQVLVPHGHLSRSPTESRVGIELGFSEIELDLDLDIADGHHEPVAGFQPGFFHLAPRPVRIDPYRVVLIIGEYGQNLS